MTGWPEHVAGVTSHARRGGPAHAFRYGVDYVLIDPDARSGPALFSRNRLNVVSVDDRNHGLGKTPGPEWARGVFHGRGLEPRRLLLLTQPRFLGYVFNPVSFWLAMDGADLLAVLAEVNNPFGDRHGYVCAHDGFQPIRANDTFETNKAMHVSPYQRVAGTYTFSFDIRADAVAIRIDFRDGDRGLLATLCGRRRPLSNRGILAALARRPAGAVRTIALIYWHALRLRLMGARYRTRPMPPERGIT